MDGGRRGIVHGFQAFLGDQKIFNELFGDILVRAGAIDVGGTDSAKWFSRFFVASWDWRDSKVDSGLHQVRPRPRSRDHHGELTLAHLILRCAVRNAFWQDA